MQAVRAPVPAARIPAGARAPPGRGGSAPPGGRGVTPGQAPAPPGGAPPAPPPAGARAPPPLRGGRTAVAPAGERTAVAPVRGSAPTMDSGNAAVPANVAPAAPVAAPAKRNSLVWIIAGVIVVGGAAAFALTRGHDKTPTVAKAPP